MQPGELAAAIEAAVKYAAEDANHVSVWMKALTSGKHDPAVTLGAMADDLEERGDWRHHIVRGSMARRTPADWERLGEYAFESHSTYPGSPATKAEMPVVAVASTFGTQKRGRITTRHADGTESRISIFPGHPVEVRWLFPHRLISPRSRTGGAHHLSLRLPVDEFKSQVLPSLPDAHAAAVEQVLKQTHPGE